MSLIEIKNNNQAHNFGKKEIKGNKDLNCNKKFFKLIS